MSAAENVVKQGSVSRWAARSGPARAIDRFLRLACSVRVGVLLLSLLGLACLIGMLVMQQNVDGFDRYFADLAPWQRSVYASLGLFDIYHSWYFNALICLVSMSIVLASIDRFPKTWLFVSKPNITVPIRWLQGLDSFGEIRTQFDHDRAVTIASKALGTSPWRKIRSAEKGDVTFIMAESGVWNRFGAYAVHVALLTIFTGGFLTAQFATSGQLSLAPGETTDLMSETAVNLDKTIEIKKRMPFLIACTDIRQRLIKTDGELAAANTIDWITNLTISDETGTHEGTVQMNQPLDYRGYRFFQSSFTPVGRARNVIIRITPGAGQPWHEVSIGRGGWVGLRDGTTLSLEEFRADFRPGEEDPDRPTSGYPNPAAVLSVSGLNTETRTVYAFRPHVKGIRSAVTPTEGATYELLDFERVADRHILAVQRDPGANVVYIGFVLLFITLGSVFLFSHQRVWAAILPASDGSRVIVAGHANRNINALRERLASFSYRLERDLTVPADPK